MPAREGIEYIPLPGNAYIEIGAGLSLTKATGGFKQGTGREKTFQLTSSGVVIHRESMTRAALIARRTAGTLVPGVSYEITDHVQGRLVAGTTITLLATSTTELSHDARVNTTYDNTSWFGLYDIDTALVYELQDNRGNIARGSTGIEVANFDWGNTSYTNVTVDNATLNINIGNTSNKTNITIDKGTVVNLTNFTGSISNFLFSGGSSVNLSSANGTWRASEIKGISTFTATSYTGGGDNYSNSIDGNSTVNFSNSTSTVTFRQNEVSGASNVTHAGVTTGTFQFTGSKIMGSSVLHNAGAGNLTINGNNHIVSGSSIFHTTGVITLSNIYLATSTVQQATNAGATMNLSQVFVKQGSNISNQSIGAINMTQTDLASSSATRTSGATGTLAVNLSQIMGGSAITNGASNTGNTTLQYSKMDGSCSINNSGATILNLTRFYLKGGSNMQAQAGSGGTLNASDTEVYAGSSITKQALSTTGVVTFSQTTIGQGGFFQTNGTGTVNITGAHIIGSSGITIPSGNRSYNFNRLIQTGVSRINLSGTGAITDTHNEMEMHYRSNYINSCSGAANTISQCELSGLSTALTLSGTTGGCTFNRIKLQDSSVNKTNNPNAGTYQLWTLSNNSVVTLSNHAANQQINYLTLDNNINVTVNRTGTGLIQFINGKNGATINLLGTSTSVNKLDVEQGSVIMNAGSASNVSKKMNSTFTINAGAQTNVHHWNATNKIATVANTNRIDYLGVVSSVPIL